LRANTRVFDSLARYGGEEFVVVMPTTGATEAEAAAERLRAAVELIIFETPTGTVAPLTVSVGVAFTAEAAINPDMLLQAADAALYEAKRNGRNRVEVARGEPAI
jgi:two-component system cell cycle response regulator